jgi:hypothetical protein
VNSQVTIHVTFAAKCSAAKFALEWTFTRVFTDVQLQILFGSEAFAAKRAQMWTAWVVFRRWTRHSSTWNGRTTTTTSCG